MHLNSGRCKLRAVYGTKQQLQNKRTYLFVCTTDALGLAAGDGGGRADNIETSGQLGMAVARASSTCLPGLIWNK